MTSDNVQAKLEELRQRKRQSAALDRLIADQAAQRPYPSATRGIGIIDPQRPAGACGVLLLYYEPDDNRTVQASFLNETVRTWLSYQVQTAFGKWKGSHATWDNLWGLASLIAAEMNREIQQIEYTHTLPGAPELPKLPRSVAVDKEPWRVDFT